MKKQYVYFLRGLPASGKSTWAREKIERDRQQNITTKRVNKDDLRAMLDNSIHSKGREKFILSVRDEIIYEVLSSGWNIIVDDTNFNPIHKERVESIVSGIVEMAKFDNNVDMNIEIVEKFFDTGVHECIKRDAKRDSPVGKKVIVEMHNKCLRTDVPKIREHDPSLLDCLIVDVDGTLALHENRRSPFEYWKVGEDILNRPVADLLTHLQHSLGRKENMYTLIMTGRENLSDEDGQTISNLTQAWLDKHLILFDDIFIRAEGDHRPDFEVKRELWEKNVKGKYNVLYVLDDRKQVIDMWREQGLTVLDVAGNEF